MMNTQHQMKRRRFSMWCMLSSPQLDLTMDIPVTVAATLGGQLCTWPLNELLRSLKVVS